MKIVPPAADTEFPDFLPMDAFASVEKITLSNDSDQDRSPVG
jgi:hypothetical protein